METNKTLQLLESHPLTVKMREEQAAEILAVRQAAFESMVLSKDEAGRQAEKIQQKIDKAMEALEAKKAALASAKSAVLTLQAERRGVLAKGERVEREQSGILIETYDDRLDEARSWFLDKQAEIRRMTADQQTRLGKKNLVTDERERTIFSNSRFIREAMLYCTAAIREIENLKLLPEYPEGRITALKEGLPDVTQYEEFSSKRLEKDASYVGRQLPWSEDQLTWEVNKVLTAAKKLARTPAPSTATTPSKKRAAGLDTSEILSVLEKESRERHMKKKSRVAKAISDFHDWRDRREKAIFEKALGR